MSTYSDRIKELYSIKNNALMHVRTLGTFEVTINNVVVPHKAWARDKTLQLFQYLVTARSRHAIHKEQIINRLWEDAEKEEGNQTFKVAMHGINKAVEPDRPRRTSPTFILRQGVAYQLNHKLIWIDAQALEDFNALANKALHHDRNTVIDAYRRVIELSQGIYLPNRIFEDWSSEERERLQVSVLSAYLSLAELLVDTQPLETIRLTQQAILVDNTWEDAYQLQMKAYLVRGNRPAAMKTYHQCVKILDKEFGLDPLPETQDLYDAIV